METVMVIRPLCARLVVMSWAVIAGCAAAPGLEKQWPMGPGPGDVYRDHTYARYFGEVDPKGTSEGAIAMRPSAGRPRRVIVNDLSGAKHAEVSVQYWGGHIGTSDQKFRVNGSDWFQIPQPAGTPTEPQKYYRTIVGDNPVKIPLSLIEDGVNTLQFRAGPQIRYGFGCGFFWVYSFTTRIYYDSSKPHVGGRIVSPLAGQTIGENPTITAQLDPEGEKVRQVDFIGLYDDYDWEGNGLSGQWHWQYKDGVIAKHIGTATEAPYSVTWDTTWIPDQDKPISIMARIVGPDRTIHITPAVTDVTFARKGRSVKMYKASGVSENFGVRLGKRKLCFIDVRDSLANATQAKLVLHTWSADHAEDIGLNGQKLVDKVGLVHDYSFDEIPVPLELVKRRNEFHIYSTTKHHAAEVNWPGPALFIEFKE
jgi:hypothetical protein